MHTLPIENINSTYFHGYYKEIWRGVIPESLTKAEVDFLINYNNLKPGSRVLDLMCGYGRHALALARQGIYVTAVDNLADYVDEVKLIAEKENLPVSSIQEDVMSFQSEEQFDLVICMGNSLSAFNQADTMKLFSLVSSHIKKGSRFIISTWMIAEIAIKQFREKSWMNINGLKFLLDCQYLFQPARVESEHLIIAEDGKTETKKAIDYIFSLNEYEEMLNKSDFSLSEIFSIPGKKKFAIGESRAYLIAKKT
jgi:2-polyprenyl-3-methyl-5-hydroxy-6-metoxy-1,4-benzoquinol methylase